MSSSASRPVVDHSISISKRNFPEPGAKPFQVKVRGHIFQGIVVKKGGKFFAYQNLCQHLPITLDLKDGNFFTHDKKYLQCHMHGAMYEADTGVCIAGPCLGATLVALDLAEEVSHVIVRIPESFGKSPPKKTGN